MLHSFIDVTQTHMHPVKSSRLVLETFFCISENHTSPVVTVQVPRPLRPCILDSMKTAALCKQPHSGWISFLLISHAADRRVLKRIWGWKFVTWNYIWHQLDHRGSGFKDRPNEQVTQSDRPSAHLTSGLLLSASASTSNSRHWA